MTDTKYVYEREMEVRDYELDAEGIVNNANYLHYLEHTRHGFCVANGISAKRRKKTAGRTPSVKPCGFATSLSEEGSGETGSFAPEPEALPPGKAPSLRGLSPQATGGVP